MFLPLDIAGGYAAAHGDRVIWLQENRGMFIAGWVNQIISMFTLSGAFAAAWIAVGNNALRGMLGLFFVAMATMAFIIPKFIAVWTIPLPVTQRVLAQQVPIWRCAAAPTKRVDSILALYFLRLFGLWLYAVFALLVAAPLYGDALSNKVAAASLGVFGVLYHFCLIALLLGSIGASDIETYFLGSTVLLFLHLVAMIAVFTGKSMVLQLILSLSAFTLSSIGSFATAIRPKLCSTARAVSPMLIKIDSQVKHQSLIHSNGLGWAVPQQGGT